MRRLLRRSVALGDALAFTIAGYVMLRLASFPWSALEVTDTASYRRTAELALWDPGFYGAERGWTIPLLYKLLRFDDVVVVAQLLLSIVCWTLLAASVAIALRGPVRAVAFVTILLFSLTFDVVAWDSILMSDSVSLSLAALALAMFIRFVQRPNALLFVGLAVVLLLWVGARDTNALVVALVAVPLAIWAIEDRETRRYALAAAAASAAIGLAGFSSANAGERWVAPLDDALKYHIQPSSAARAWFTERGMPTDTAAYYTWLRTDARRLYARYLLSRPIATLVDPGRSLERLDELLAPDLRPYPIDVRETLPRWVEEPLYPATSLTLLFSVVVVAIALVIAARRYAVLPLVLVPITVVALMIPHTLLVWHASGQEFGRHSLLGVVFSRLGVLMVALVVADALVARLPRHAR